MISINNFDSSFFKISSGAFVPIPMSQSLSERVISLEIVEEIGKMTSGTITFQESDLYEVTWALKMGTAVDVIWGYSNIDLSGNMAYKLYQNPNEITGMLSQRSHKFLIQNPSGAGNENGDRTFNCNLISAEGFGFDAGNVYFGKFMSKGSIVATVMSQMGINLAFIKFRRAPETGTAYYKDNKKNFKYLCDLALEWRCVFRIGYTPSKIPCALFCDYDDDVTAAAFFSATMGVSGLSSTFEYQEGIANVKKFSWEHQSSDTGGDNVRIIYVNGAPTFIRSIATTEGIVYYKMNPDKINVYLAKLDGLAKVNAMADLLKIDNMAVLVQKGFFEPMSETTAPQGMGFSLSIETIGNPFNTAPARCNFGKGFPEYFAGSSVKKGLIFYMISVSHKISRQGYSNSIKVGDGLTVMGGSMVG